MENTIDYVTMWLTSIHIENLPHGDKLLEIENKEPLSSFNFRDDVRRIHRLYAQPLTDPIDTLTKIENYFEKIPIKSSSKPKSVKRNRNGNCEVPSPVKKRYVAKKTVSIPETKLISGNRSYSEDKNDVLVLENHINDSDECLTSVDSLN